MKIGILALQGTFIEHVHSIKKLGADTVEIRRPDELEGVDGIIIPGGESTTITHLMDYYGLVHPLKEMAQKGIPFLGTCAGMICMARSVGSPVNLQTLELMDIRVNRNAFGRQVASFEQALDIPVLGPRPFPGLFIRGPVIEDVGDGVEILARLENGTPIAARQGRLIATSFHPELMDDLRLHRYFLSLIG
ncbi:MAG: pyridoxal 5'-phosphate synthase glutaminase subunit PdxT [Dehalococcoidaceae bacterium]|nr:pyridoxal 5'-phosphate synthase glutaminase subunit PdxT [Dehalococcoidaceae bacterium]